MSKSSNNYLPAVDGLRAVAVLAVIANHMTSAILPGGYLGVDIFFVISGFVITQSLLSRRRLSAGQLMLDFYARRMKRLLPALVLVVIVGVLLIRLFDPKPITSTVTGALALVGASNIFLFSEAIDYFGGAAALNIFTHTWSLGVEEQFYLAYPLLFCLTANVSSLFRLGILAALSLASVIAFVVVAKINQPATYFLMPFRFWELGLGCLASLALAHHQEHLALLRRLPASIPFVAMLIGLALPDAWQVAATLLTVVSTTTLLLTLSRGSAPQKLLSSSAIVYIGRISYSVYLWHWLVICLSVWTIGIHWWSIPFQITVIFAVATLSYRFLEAPLRYGRLMGSGWRTIAAGAALIIFGIVVIGATHSGNLIQFAGSSAEASMSQPLAPGYVALHSGRRIDDCRPNILFDYANGKFRGQLVDGCRAGKVAPLLVFMGDSHAMDLFAMADLVAARGEASVLNVAQDGCRAPPLSGEAAYCHYQSALIDLLARQGANVVLVLRNNYNPRGIDRSLDHFIAEITGLLDKASAVGMRIVYIAPGPKYASVGPTSLCSVQWFRPSWAIGERCEGDLIESRVEQQARRREFLSALQNIQRQRKDFLVFDPFDTLCGRDTVACTPKREGRLFYRDESHLTEEGSEMLADPFIETLRASGWLPTQ